MKKLECPAGSNQNMCFAAHQWAQQGVTLLDGVESITSMNSTASGYPEISYFLKEDYFTKNVPNAAKY